MKPRERPTKTVVVFWKEVDVGLLQLKKALYMYRTVKGKKLLLIGKAGRETVRQRWACPSKERVSRLATKVGISSVKPYIGCLFTSLPLTHSLVHDVEKVLIFNTQPSWNETGKKSYTMARARLSVECTGDWPHPEWFFQHPPPRDIGIPMTTVIKIPCFVHTNSLPERTRR